MFDNDIRMFKRNKLITNFNRTRQIQKFWTTIRNILICPYELKFSYCLELNLIILMFLFITDTSKPRGFVCVIVEIYQVISECLTFIIRNCTFRNNSKITNKGTDRLNFIITLHWVQVRLKLIITKANSK